DDATAGRCSNNRGIISHLRGRHAEAIASWEIALAAFDGAAWRPGVAHCHHNLGLTYRDQGALDRALTEADWAVTEAEASGDHTLWALALRGRAEIRVAQGEIGLARRALDEVRAIRSRVPDPADEAEDQRAMALVLTAEGELTAAERALRDVMVRAEGHRRPQLLAEATRDLAIVLRRAGRSAEAQAAARAAQAIFGRLGAEAEIRSLASQEWEDDFGAQLGRSLAPLHAAQALAEAGDYGRAVGACTREIAAYQKARNERGIAETQHNLGIAYREQGRLDDAMHATDTAMREAERLGDRRLKAQALAGRAEIQVARGDPE